MSKMDRLEAIVAQLPEAEAVVATDETAEPTGYGLGRHGWVFRDRGLAEAVADRQVLHAGDEVALRPGGLAGDLDLVDLFREP